LRQQLIKAFWSRLAFGVEALGVSSRAMLTLIELLQTLLVSGIMVYVTYCSMRFTAYCVVWLIEISFRPADDLRRYADRTPARMVPKTWFGWGNLRLTSYLGETNHASVE
jgi:hypothetical protein